MRQRRILFPFLAFFLSAAAGLLLFTPGASAAPSDAETIRAVERYFAGLKTAEARFRQTVNGNELMGSFYLSRPGRLRFEYDAPIRDFIVADGTFVYFYDAELGEQSSAFIGQTLADFILRKDLKLSGDIAVARIRRANGLLEVTVRQAGDPGAGALTLYFKEDPMQLAKWRIVDATGAETLVELYALQTGGRLDSGLFVYIDPKRFEGNRFNK